jgi:Fe-S cluster biosynthesis and repair protein YggX
MAIVTCRCCGQEGEAPSNVLWGGALGETIRSEVCAPCWGAWEEMSVKIVNEYRLSMSNPEHYKLLVEQLKSFLRLEAP